MDKLRIPQERSEYLQTLINNEKSKITPKIQKLYNNKGEIYIYELNQLELQSIQNKIDFETQEELDFFQKEEYEILKKDIETTKINYAIMKNTQGQTIYEGFIKIDQNKSIQFHGQGIYKNIEKNTFFEGEYIENKKFFGTFETPEQTYSGYWENDMPHNQGKLIFKNGEWYEGPFQNGLYHGKGVYYSKRGEEFIHCAGRWNKGKRTGKFTLKNKNSELKVIYKNGNLTSISSLKGNLKDFQLKQDVARIFDYDQMIPIIQKKIKKVQKNSSKITKNNFNINQWFQDQKFDMENQECAICLENLNNKEQDSQLALFPCFIQNNDTKPHIFHQQCIQKWVENGNKLSCPLCRTDIKCIDHSSIQGDGKNMYFNFDLKKD